MAILSFEAQEVEHVPSSVVARKKMKPLWSHLVFYGNLVFLVIHSKTSENYFKHQMTILLIGEKRTSTHKLITWKFGITIEAF